MKLDQQRLYLGVIAIVAILAISGGSWLYQQNHQSTDDNSPTAATNKNQFPGDGQFGGRGNGQFSNANFSRISGTLQAKSETSLTIKTDSGDTTVTINSETRIGDGGGRDAASLTVDDLTLGETVNAMGEKDSSGNITARMVFIGTMPSPPQDEGATINDSSSSSNSI